MRDLVCVSRENAFYILKDSKALDFGGRASLWLSFTLSHYIDSIHMTGQHFFGFLSKKIKYLKVNYQNGKINFVKFLIVFHFHHVMYMIQIVL
jgi:hypothetical protein